MALGGTEEAVAVASDPRIRARVGRVYWGWWLVGVAFVAQFVTTSAQNYIIGAFTRPMTQDLGWARSEFLLARSAGQFVMAVTGLFIGAYVDRHGGRRLMAVGVALLAVAMFLCSFVTELWQWWLLNGVALTVGAAMAGNFVVNVTLSKWFVERRGQVAGTAAMGVSFAGVLVPPISAALIELNGWRAAWRLLAIGAFVLAFPLTFLMRRTPEDSGIHPDGKSSAEVAAGSGRAAEIDFDRSLTRSQAIRTPTFYLVASGFGFGTLSIGVMILQGIPYLVDAGYSNTFAALMITLASVPSMLSKPIWGWLADRVDAKIAVIGFMANAVAIVSIVISVRAHAEWGIYGGFFLLGLGWGGLIPLQEVVWASFFGRRYLGAVRSAGLPFALIIGASAPFLTAYYFDQVGNYDGAFLTVAALAVVATVLLLFAQKPIDRRGAAADG